jgi:hypothetical protein
MTKPKNHNYNPSNRLSPEDWAQRFDLLLLIERKIVFEIGDALIAAQEELSKAGFLEAIKKSGLRTKTTALNYMRVAQSEHLRAPEVQQQLPATVGALIDLAAWKEDEIKAAIEKNVLHPQSQRKALQSWLEEHRRRWIIDFSEEPQAPEFPDDAVIAGYIMASASELTPVDQKRFEKIVYELNRQMPNFNFYVTTQREDSSISFRRAFDLSQRILKAYRESPELFVDSHFERLLKADDGKREMFFDQYVGEFAKLIASADHAKLHKVLKFSKAEWKFLGVDNPGHPTVLPFIDGALMTAKKPKSVKK